MRKRNYTHIQKVLPKIETMIAQGKTQREVAEYFEFKDKHVVKELLKRQRCKKGDWKREFCHGRKGPPAKC